LSADARVAGRDDGRDDDASRASARLGVALSDDEMRRIAEHLGRDPTRRRAARVRCAVERALLLQVSRALLAPAADRGPDVMLGPGEDAGIVHLGEWKGETLRRS
jgi:phosphoribosylformylglycinamidine (FGAM) synthase-like enzyme